MGMAWNGIHAGEQGRAGILMITPTSFVSGAKCHDRRIYNIHLLEPRLGFAMQQVRSNGVRLLWQLKTCLLFTTLGCEHPASPRYAGRHVRHQYLYLSSPVPAYISSV